MVVLSFNKVKKYYGSNLILDNLSFEVKSGERIGLIGKNGSGKTTIFKIISKLEEFEEGNIICPKSLSIGYLEQEITISDLNVKEYIYSGFQKISEYARQMKEYEKKLENYDGNSFEEILEKYGKLQEKYELAGGYNTDEKFNRVCQGMKFDEKFLEKNLFELSGGEKIKVTLAKVLVRQPDLLLLDEPTNHLDLDSISWLEKFFREYTGTIIIISHDRYFLDNVINKVIELEDLKAKEYIGNYSSYIQQKREYIERQIVLYNAQQRKIKSMEEAIVRFRVWGNNGFDKAFRSAENMRKRLSRMDKIDKPRTREKEMKMSFEKSERFGKRVLKIENLSKSFDNKKLFKDINIDLIKGEKAVIVGRNGSGKSTLLNIIMGKLDFDSGNFKVHEKCKPAYIGQDVDFGKDSEKTVLEYLSRELEISEKNTRNILGKFLFIGEDVFKKIKYLSGGEKLKLKFCELTQNKTNFLILDEPTNHLDIASRDILESALNDFEGTVLIVSHDRYFINKTVNQIYELDNGGLNFYDGNFDYYDSLKKSKKNSKIMQKENLNTQKLEKEIDIKQEKEIKTISKNKLRNLKNEIMEMEVSLNNIEEELELNSVNHEKLVELYELKTETEDRLMELYEISESVF